jgi:hypothetical protein
MYYKGHDEVKDDTMLLLDDSDEERKPLQVKDYLK